MSDLLPPGDGTQPCIENRDLFDEPGLATQEEAKQLCRNECPFLAECRAYALQGDEHGVWGATTRDERRAIQRRRDQLAADLRRRERAALRQRITELDDGARSVADIARTAGCTARFVHLVRRERRTTALERGKAA